MDISCAAIPCPVILNATCVFYEGETLVYTGINSGDNLQTALQKIDAKFEDAGLGYVFVNGIIQTAPGVPVELGGSLTHDTTIGGNYRLTFAGSLESQAFVTTGGNSSQFVKGDGSLDNTSYQPSGNYLTDLTGDGTANGPGSAAFTLATVNATIGTFGTSTMVPRITVNNKGLVTNVVDTLITVPSGVLIFTGDVTGSGMTGSPVTLTLLPVNVDVYGPNTFLKFAVNAKGLVTSATLVTAFDIIGALGYTPVPTTRTITINGVTRDLSVNRTFSVGTVTNVSVSSGVGISASVADPTNAPIITITNTAPDRIVHINSGANINVTGTYPNFTIAAVSNGGTVTSVGMTVPTGLTIGGSPITTSGILALGLDSGYSIPTISNQNTWTTAYNHSIISAAVTGAASKILTLNRQDGGTVTASWNDDGLTSVGLSMPSAFTVSSSPLTSNGTISVTGAGITAEYIRGDGSLATFPSLAGYLTNVTATAPILSSGGTTPDISIPAATTSVSGYLTSTDWNTFDGKQPQLNGTGFVKASGTTITYDNSTYLTTISGIAAGGELSGTYANPTLVNSAVIGKVLTGFNVTGGSVVATDDILTAFGKVQNQINGLVGGLIYQGAWNASTNTPALTSGVGTEGYFYITSVAGTTNLDGNANWHVGDWAVFNGSVWQLIDNTDSVTSVNGFIGAVVLSTTDIAEGTNLYYTDTRARNAISGGTGISYAPSTGIITNSAPDQTVTLSNGTAISVTGTYPSFTIANTAPDQTVSLSNGTGISVSGTYPNFTITNTAPSSGGTITGTGTTNTLPKFTSASSIGDSNVKDNGNAVTINATAGSFGALQVGNYNGSILMNTTSSSGGLIFQNTSSSNKLWDFSSFGDDINFNESGVATPVMTLKSGGNIGVNTTIPSNKFEVNGTFKAVGVATFGSTLSNGTYSYTLPGATGTLALIGDLSGYVPTSRTLTINGVGYDLSADRSWTVTSMVYPSAGIALSTGTAWGTSITDNSADWNTAYSSRIASLTTIGTSGAATLIANVLNIPNYSTDLSGYVPYTGATTNLNLGSFNLTSTNVTANGTLTLLGNIAASKTVSSGSPYSFVVTQNSTNATDTGDGALYVNHILSGVGSGTELVTRSFIFSSDNQRTGGSVLSNSRVLYLVSSTQSGTTTTNLDQVYIEGGAMVGTVTNNRGVLVKTMQGTNQAAFVATGLTSSNRVHLLLGNYTLPTGAWGIYSGLSDASYLQGSLLLGSATDDTVNKLQVTGAAKITGQLTLSSTITNGTYTYTLPGATGTIALVGGAGVGTVTSVATAGTVSGLTLTGGTITTTGTITLGGTLSVLPSNFASQTANTVLAAPSGSAGVPTFRALVAADIPSLSGSYLPLTGGTLTGSLTVGVTSGLNLILDKSTGAYLSFQNGATIRGSISGNSGADGLNLNYGASHTTALAISSTGAATFSSSVTATSFSGAGTGLTGTAASLSIGGSAGSAGYLTGGDSAAYMLLYNSLGGDLNTYNSPGLYSAEYTGSTNRPTAQNGSFIQISDAGGTDVKTQWYYQADGAGIYMRLQWGSGTWRSWRTLITDSNIGSQSVSYATTSGSAGSATTATYATNATRLYASDSPYCYGCAAPYYLSMTYDGTRWFLQTSPATPAAVRVSYADSAGSATTAAYLTGRDAYTNGSDGWFRSNGNAGWYNATYAVGIYATDGTWVRTYNNAQFYSSTIIQAGASMRAPIFYDSDDTTYYLDMNSTSDSAGRIRGGILFGPNTTWGAYLRVGGNGNPDTSYANVGATNGNLHLDSKAGYAMYLNNYAPGIIYLNGGTYNISANGSQYNGNSATASGQNSGANFTVNTGGAGYGLVGVYNPSVHQGFFAMGAAYTLSAAGGLANFYGVSWTYDCAGYPLNTGYCLQHCMAVANAGTVYTIIGQGIWTSGLIRANSYISTGSYISAASSITAGTDLYLGGSSSGQVRMSTYNSKNLQVIGTSGTDVGILGTVNGSSTFGFQLYGSGGNFGFLSSAWGSWAIRMNTGGDIVANGAISAGGNISGGYILGSYFNSSAGNSENPTIGQIWTQSTGDNYLRKSTPAHLISQLGLVTSGSSPTFSYVYLSVLAGSDYGALMYSNNGSSYTQWRIAGSKNGYGGISDGYSNVHGIMYDSSGNGGVYREINGLWYWYYALYNTCMGINSSATSSSYGLYVTGSIYTTGILTQASDVRKKTDIVTIDNALEKVTQMRGVYFTKIGEEEKGRQTGVIAQEINEILPEIVIHAKDVDEYSVAYGNAIGVLIEAIKEQQLQIEELKNKLNI